MLVGEVKWPAGAVAGSKAGPRADPGALPGAANVEAVHTLFVPDAAGAPANIDVVDARTVMAALR